jgi:hypothetical protein
LLVLDELVLELLLEVEALVTDLLQAVDGIHYEMEAVPIIQAFIGGLLSSFSRAQLRQRCQRTRSTSRGTATPEQCGMMRAV